MACSKTPTQVLTSCDENDPELARINQDKALEVLGLHRYRIAGDGNCLFRAVAWQLKLDQDEYHPVLREVAAKWMRNHKTELMDWGLLDDGNEITDTEKLGVWPGQAAIVALSNILRANVAVIQGGDKGDIDIQHISPFETESQSEEGSIILAYLYNGHYDAIVEQPHLENPDFEAWTLRCKRDMDASEALARQLAAHNPYSAVPPVKIHERMPQKSSVPLVLNSDPVWSGPSLVEPPSVTSKPAPVHGKPDRPKLPPAVDFITGGNDHGQDGDLSVRVTVYPKASLNINDEKVHQGSSTCNPADANMNTDPALKVTRKEPTRNILQERQRIKSPPHGPTRSPTIRVIPIQYISRTKPQDNENSEKQSISRGAIRKKDYVPANTLRSRSPISGSSTPPETSWSRQHKHDPWYQPSEQHYVNYSTNDDPVGGHYSSRAQHHPVTMASPHSHHDSMNHTSTSSPRMRSRDVPPVPIIVLSAKSPDRHRKSVHREPMRGDPVTYNLNQPFQVPPELRPYRRAMGIGEVQAMLSGNTWLFD